LAKALIEIRNQLRQLKDPSKLLLNIATQYKGDSQHRIFTEGRKSSGASIGTYSAATKRTKQRKGRFSSNKINLRDTEDLVGAYAVQVKNKKKVVVGFEELRKDGSNAKLVDVLEDRYGDIFSPTSEEDKNIDKLLDSFTKGLF